MTHSSGVFAQDPVSNPQHWKGKGEVHVVQAALLLAIAEDKDLGLKFFYLLKCQHFILFIYLFVYLFTYFEGRVSLR